MAFPGAPRRYGDARGLNGHGDSRGALAWLGALLGQVQEFTRERGGRAPVIRITLADGEHVRDRGGGPANEFVTLHSHPHDEPLSAPGGRLPPGLLPQLIKARQRCDRDQALLSVSTVGLWRTLMGISVTA